MTDIRPIFRAQMQPSALRRLCSSLIGVTGTFALSACMSEVLDVDPVNALVDDAVAAKILVSNPTQITVVGSKEWLGAAAFDANGADLCAARYVGCAPQLLTRPFQWRIDVPGVVSLAEGHDKLLNASVRVVALAEGRVKLTASLDGLEATTTVDVVERARIKWSVPTLGSAVGIAVGEDGTVYFAGGRGLHAVGPDGEVRWVVRSESGCCFSGIPAIAADGTVYVGTTLGTREGLAAIDPGGNVLWVAPIKNPRGAAAIGPDGTIYQISSQGILYAVDPTGRTKWRFVAGPGDRNFTRSSPAIAEDGTIYFASEDHHLYAIDPSGRERWRFQTAGPVRSASIGLDGTIYFGNDRILLFDDTNDYLIAAARMYALNPDGSERWSAELGDAKLGDDVWAAPAIGFDGTLYMGTGHWMHVFSPDGALLSKKESRADTHGGYIHTPILAGDGSIYATGGPVSALDRDGTLRWHYRPGNFAGPQPAIGLDGTIYAGETQYAHAEPPRLLAFTELTGNNGGYDRAPWPTERGDRANTGRARRRP